MSLPSRTSPGRYVHMSNPNRTASARSSFPAFGNPWVILLATVHSSEIVRLQQTDADPLSDSGHPEPSGRQRQPCSAPTVLMKNAPAPGECRIEAKTGNFERQLYDEQPTSDQETAVVTGHEKTDYAVCLAEHRKRATTAADSAFAGGMWISHSKLMPEIRKHERLAIPPTGQAARSASTAGATTSIDGV